ncbi:hypothetical protein AZ025_000451, partial [Escherichia coli]
HNHIHIFFIIKMTFKLITHYLKHVFHIKS